MNNSWSLLSKIVAVLMTLVYAVYVSNAVLNYIPLGSVILDYISNIVYFGPIVICALTAMGAVGHKNLLTKILFLAVWVLIFLFSFFPDVFYNLFF